MAITKKTVAILSPVAWRTPPRQYGAWETVASNITEGLVTRGWDVTLFASRDSVTRAHLHAVVDRGYEEDSTADPKVAEYLHISTAGDEPFGNVASDRLPSAVLARRGSPGDRRQYSHSHVALDQPAHRCFLVHGCQYFIEPDGGEACGVIGQSIRDYQFAPVD